jgi:hypothetical protein
MSVGRNIRVLRWVSDIWLLAAWVLKQIDGCIVVSLQMMVSVEILRQECCVRGLCIRIIVGVLIERVP